ncbi:MAG: hypothetical protein J7502_05995 [Flavisolibacter sp.]|nr:hypothetical protein [Flavisolibacter sp.]
MRQFFIATAVLFAASAHAQSNAVFTVKANEVKAIVQPTMWGFCGNGIKTNNQYDFSVLARQNKESNVVLNVELVNSKRETIGSTSLTPAGEQWKKHHGTITATQTDPKASLNVWFSGSVFLNTALY